MMIMKSSDLSPPIPVAGSLWSLIRTALKVILLTLSLSYRRTIDVVLTRVSPVIGQTTMKPRPNSFTEVSFLSSNPLVPVTAGTAVGQPSVGDVLHVETDVPPKRSHPSVTGENDDVDSDCPNLSEMSRDLHDSYSEDAPAERKELLSADDSRSHRGSQDSGETAATQAKVFYGGEDLFQRRDTLVSGMRRTASDLDEVCVCPCLIYSLATCVNSLMFSLWSRGLTGGFSGRYLPRLE